MKKYNIINNSLGWLCFVVAALTYLLTLEPTASFWDCPEFILQGAKLEIGHPPGNPIFMLTARFFITLFGNNMHTAAIAVNSMSALLSAGTILLLFWTITHLIRKLIVPDGATDIPLGRMLLIMGGGLCGALAYTWSDTFWFSAVEGEVYAFSSFCTALVFWLILKWENRADQPHADSYLLLIAYIIGISIAVHLLNLLCIPAIGLVIYYRKFRTINAVGSLIALVVSCAVVGLILFGMVPGVMKMTQAFELLMVNGLGFSFNIGVLTYAIVLLAVLIWSVTVYYRQRSQRAMKWALFLSVVLSGTLLIGHTWLLPVLLTAALAVWLMFFCKRLPVHILNLVVVSILMVFVGYSSYALLLIRSGANTPMNQNAPDNVFTLASYLNREQYGQTPLLYGPTVIDAIYEEHFNDGGGLQSVMYFDEDGYFITDEDITGQPTSALLYQDNGYPVDNSDPRYVKRFKSDREPDDAYILGNNDPEYEYIPEACILLPRMYNAGSNSGYRSWSQMPRRRVPAEVFSTYARPEREILTQDSTAIYFVYADEVTGILHDEGFSQSASRYQNRPEVGMEIIKAPYESNLAYFINYQLNHMYWRYFMWNFAGRQNDFAGNGEPHLGNWISGIAPIDNARLGDQSLLPAEYGTANKGHNVFYMLPLLLGIIGLLWQSLCRHISAPNRGIEQFWVIFFLFFMTGIAIVLYLNQPPGQPRERDYAFAGSFYAFAIWIGMGVPALGILLSRLFSKKAAQAPATAQPTPAAAPRLNMACVIAAVAVGIAVPLQMVSQTWDDHDRSGRYTARDFGMNYLSSVEPNAVIFTYGDNDTFPLWYAQEVENYRTDVKVVNLSYFGSGWYVNSLRMPHHNSVPIDLWAPERFLAYDSFYASSPENPNPAQVTAQEAFKSFYTANNDGRGTTEWLYPNFYIASDEEGANRAFDLKPGSVNYELGFRNSDMLHNFNTGMGRYQNRVLTIDMVAKNAAEGWNRPLYFAVTVPTSERSGLNPYVYSTGMADRITPFASAPVSPFVETAFRNILEKYRWGGLDAPDADKLYLDETVRRMVMSTRGTMLANAMQLIQTGPLAASDWAKEYAAKKGLPVPATRYDMARIMLQTLDEKLPAKATLRASHQVDQQIQMWLSLYDATGNKADLETARRIYDEEMPRYEAIVRYARSLDPDKLSKAANELSADLSTYRELQTLGRQIEAFETGEFEPEIDTDAASFHNILLPAPKDTAEVLTEQEPASK